MGWGLFVGVGEGGRQFLKRGELQHDRGCVCGERYVCAWGRILSKSNLKKMRPYLGKKHEIWAKVL